MERYPINHFLPPDIPTPRLSHFTQISNPLLIITPRLFGTLEYAFFQRFLQAFAKVRKSFWNSVVKRTPGMLPISVCMCVYVCVSVHFTSLLFPSRGGRMQVLSSESKIVWADFTDWMLIFAAKLDGTLIVAMQVHLVLGLHLYK